MKELFLGLLSKPVFFGGDSPHQLDNSLRHCDAWWLLPLHFLSAGTHTHKSVWLPNIGTRVKNPGNHSLGLYHARRLV